MKDISTIGIDIAKHVFYVCGLNQVGRVILRKRLYRVEVLDFMRQMNLCLVGMEACAGAHYWGREFQKIGHTVKLMPPQYVKPYVKRNKNDTNDAEACAEAVTRPTMRFVEVKTERQQELAQIHRIRERLVRSRTALSNEVRGFLSEFGVVIPKGVTKLCKNVMEALEKHTERLSTMTREHVSRLVDEFLRLEEEIEFYEKKISAVHKSMPESIRLDTIGGVGEITATAIVAAVSNPTQFKNRRQFAAYFGLVPQQHSTGGKPRLGKISKRGDVYIRKLLVQGAHAEINAAKKRDDRRSLWIKELCARRGRCVAAVAVANKNARIAWALLARGGEFDRNHYTVRAA